MVSAKLSTALLSAEKQRGRVLYAVGGPVRDLLLNVPAGDLDLVVPTQPVQWANTLVEILGGGTIVPLSEDPGEEAVRVIWKGEQVDFAAYRAGANSLEEDLWLRDFSLNAMAVPFAQYARQQLDALVDPCGGAEDIRQRRLRHLPGAFTADPLRMLRGYRFAAKFGFSLAEESCKAVRRQAASILNVAAERRSYELRQIFSSNRTTEAISRMARDGLLRFLIPELYLAEGVSQPPEFHHLPVLEHCFLALEMMERIVLEPEKFFPDTELLASVRGYLEEEEAAPYLKWAALLHDIGKPETKKEIAHGRTTFHGHDLAGKKLFETFAQRSRWSGEDTRRVGQLIDMHMHPFHLVTLQRQEGVSRKAALRFSKKAGHDFSGLFLLALSDCLAGNPKHQKRMRNDLIALFVLLEEIHRRELLPVMQGEPLLGGRDLIDLGLVPGPLFTTILTSLEEARVEGLVTDRQSALVWVKKISEQGLSNTNKVATTCVK